MSASPPQPAPATPDPAPKKKSGCLTMLASVGALGLVVVLAVVGYAWHRGWLEKLYSGGKLAMHGMSAPGASEVRALGCDQAMVMSADEVAHLIDHDAPNSVGLVVSCVAHGDSAPSCNDVAETYVKAVGGSASAPFVVRVDRGGGKHCTERYASDGTHQWD